MATDEKQVANSQPVDSTYEVPLLGISGLEKGETEIRIKFAGELEGLKGKAYIDNSKGGVTKIKMRFDDMKMAPKQKRYVLWAVSRPRNNKIGQVINRQAPRKQRFAGTALLSSVFGNMETKT